MRRLLLTCAMIVAGSGCSNQEPAKQHVATQLATIQSSDAVATEKIARPTPSIPAQNLKETEPTTVNPFTAASSLDSQTTAQLPAQSASEDEILVFKKQVTSRVESLVKQFPDDADALEAKARFYLMLGDLEVARSCWEHAIVVAPDYGYAHQGLGSIALRNSDYQLAVSHLTRAVEFMPDDFLAAHELSDAHLKNGDLDSAIEVLENQLTVGAPRSDTWQLLGQARIANRQYEAAGQAFEESLKLEPMNHLAKQGIGSVLVRMGKRDEARKLLEEQQRARATKNQSNDQTIESERSQFATRLELVARVWLKHGRLNEALEVVHDAVGCAAGHEGSRLLLSTIWQRLNQPQRALEVVRELTTLAPQNPSYWMAQGSLSLQLQQWKTADESFEKFIHLVPASPDGYAALAQTLIISGLDRERAVIAARRVTELRGSAADFATYSQSLAISGKIKESIQAMQVAISKDPQSQNYKALLQQLLQAEETR